MTTVANDLPRATVALLLTSDVQGAAGTVDGTGIDTKDYEGMAIASLNAKVGTGTTPTLDVKIQESDTLGGTYTDVTGAAFAQVTDVAGTAGVQKIAIDISGTKRFIRARSVAGGTTPSFNRSCTLIAQKKYN